MLDGLDELARNEEDEEEAKIRADCLKSLNAYLDRGKKAVICCRVKEFEQMQSLTGRDAPVSAKVKVNNLSEAEVLNSLLKAQHSEADKFAATHLLEILEKDENNVFLEVLRIPFYFTITLEVFDKTNLEEKEKNIPKEEKLLKDYLREKFVKKKLNRKLSPNEYKREKTIKWLNWLALFMNEKKLISFELVHLQPFDYRIRGLFSFIFGIISGVSTFLLFNYSVGIIVGVITGLSSLNAGIQTSDIITWSFKKLLSIKHWIIVTVYGGFLGLIIGASFGIVFDFVFSLIFGTICGIIIMFFTFIFGAVRQSTSFRKIDSTYQRLNNGVTFIYFSGLFVVITIYLTWYSLFFLLFPNETPKLDLIRFFILGSLLGVFWIPIVKHLILRFSLYLLKYLPFKYATFLDYCAEARILEKDGGHWRFRHQNLQDYFAELEIDK